MKVDQNLPFDTVDTAAAARAAKDAGYSGIWSAETQHDPLIALAAAAHAVDDIDVGTGIAVAFARNPMNLAVSGNDLQLLTKGRFMLGMGSQIKPHITRRFSMPWSHPAPRMREFVLAMRAIWAAWAGDEPLKFEGEFYTHTLMSPFFNPGPNLYGPPPVLLAGVGSIMTEVAGEVADGFLCHGFTTERFVREVSLPALEAGAAKSGRNINEVSLFGAPLIVTGGTDEEFATADAAVRAQIAFYASTPAYRPVLELHGWGEVQGELTAMTKSDRWGEMGAVITDEMLDAFAVVGAPETIAPELLRRYGDLWTRLTLYTPYPLAAESSGLIAAALLAGPAREIAPQSD